MLVYKLLALSKYVLLYFKLNVKLNVVEFFFSRNGFQFPSISLIRKTTTNNISENAADIIFPNLQKSMRSNN